MAQFEKKGSARRVQLESDILIGRSIQCRLRLDNDKVSSSHANLQWTGEHWEIRDLGSRNKTLLNGKELLPGVNVPLRLGAEVVFGCPAETWTVVDDGPPAAMAVALDGKAEVLAVDGLLALPSSECPLVTIHRDRNGAWISDSEHGPVSVTTDSVVNAGGRLFRVCVPHSHIRTSPIAGFNGKRVSDVQLKFEVSRDLEHILVEVTCDTERSVLSARGHNEILLVLARARGKDQLQGIPGSDCGWMYFDDLCRDVASEATRANVDVYRIRRQFASLGLLDPANIIERRPRARQIRIGTSHLVEVATH